MQLFVWALPTPYPTVFIHYAVRVFTKVINASKRINTSIQGLHLVVVCASMQKRNKANSICSLHKSLTSVTPRRSAVKGLLPVSSDRKQLTEGMKVNTPVMDTSMMSNSKRIHIVSNWPLRWMTSWAYWWGIRKVMVVL